MQPVKWVYSNIIIVSACQAVILRIAMKYCKDCRHFTSVNGCSHCAAPQNQTLSPDGTSGLVCEYCEVQRVAEGPDKCGKTGRWFEPRSQ